MQSVMSVGVNFNRPDAFGESYGYNGNISSNNNGSFQMLNSGGSGSDTATNGKHRHQANARERYRTHRLDDNAHLHSSSNQFSIKFNFQCELSIQHAASAHPDGAEEPQALQNRDAAAGEELHLSSGCRHGHRE